jgi:hypothetical protein
MTRNIKHIVWILVLQCNVFVISAQIQVSVTATVNRRQILIGEPIQLTLEAKLPLGVEMSWFPLDSIPHFDFVEKGKLDSSVTADGKSFRQDLLITSFDSGIYEIPSLPLGVNNQKYLTDSIAIEVSYSKINPNQDYHDIKDILEVENPAVGYLIWIILSITLISLVLFGYFVRKKKQIREMEKEQEIVARLSPYEEAMNALNELRKQGLPEQAQVKLYYTQLNDIFKKFVLRKLKIASLSKTNEELIIQLARTDIPRERFTQLTQALRMSDFVKFAKYTPGKTDNEDSFNIIRSSIDILNEIEK